MTQLMIEIQIGNHFFSYAVRGFEQGYALFKFHDVKRFRFYTERYH